MRVDSIGLENFRNYKNGQFEFSPERNIIYGENAQGKTNLLEAVYYLSGAKSFRAVRDSELIKAGESFSLLEADIFGQDRNSKIRAELYVAPGRRKTIYINGAKAKRASELSGRICMVVFSPDDMKLVREGAAYRRRFLDSAISQLRPKYSDLISRYAKLHEHKTRILKDYREKPGLIDTLDSFNDQIAQTGAMIIGYRAWFISRMSNISGTIHSEISGKNEKLRLKYRTVSTIEDASLPARDLYQAILRHMESHRSAELRSGMALSGPHKDDMEIFVGDMPAKTYASQGQTRTAALSLKLSEQEIFYQDRGEYPVLLLDDVLSELDEYRRDYVLNRIDRGQVFITLCDRREISVENASVFHISGGAAL